MATQTPVNGAKRLIQCLERQGVEVIFGYQGGAAMPIFDALMGSSIKLIPSRHEQGAMHMADGYARATGKPGVVLVTSGPGATNTVTGLFTAHMDSVPVVLITGQIVSSLLGKDGFQEADITGITYAVTKHSYLLKKASDVPRVVAEAFHIATVGRPGPVVIDMPRDVSMAPCDAPFVDQVVIPGYNVPTRPAAADLQAAVRLIQRSRKPVLYIGHGAVISGAGPAIMHLAEKLGAVIVNSLLGKGACPEDHDRHLGLLGMHGTPYANKAVYGCDLIMAIGARWDDRITSKISEFAPGATKIHIDIDPAEFNKVIRPDVCLAGDARLVVEDLLPLVERLDSAAWLAQCRDWRKQFPLRYAKKGGLRPQLVLDRLDQLGGRDCIICTDVGQNQMWSAQYCRVTKNRHWISSGGAGTMGFGLPSAIGAAIATRKKTWAIVGDGGFQMTLCELATAALHQAPVKVLILNNHYLGMIRQWQDLFFDGRFHGSPLEGSPDFVKLAGAYGIQAWRIKRPAEVDKVLKAAMAWDQGPCLVEADVITEEHVFPMIPPGKSYADMMIEAPKAR